MTESECDRVCDRESECDRERKCDRESECDREYIFQMLHTAGGACIQQLIVAVILISPLTDRSHSQSVFSTESSCDIEWPRAVVCGHLCPAHSRWRHCPPAAERIEESLHNIITR